MGRTLINRLSGINCRMDLAYQDRLDGKISEEFWIKKSAEWQQEEMQLRDSSKSLEDVKPERYLNASRSLELANKEEWRARRDSNTRPSA